MPVINSYADVLRDWESLLNACRQNAELLTGVDPVAESLERHLGRLKEVKNEQEQLEGTRKAATQRLRAAREEGSETARQLRSLVRSRLGTKNERLVQFRVAPIRRKTRRKAEGEVKTAPEE